MDKTNNNSNKTKDYNARKQDNGYNYNSSNN